MKNHRGPAYWLAKTNWVDKIHGSNVLAAKHVEAVEEICSLYQEAIDYMTVIPSSADQQDIGVDSDAKGQLQYFQAALRFHGSHSQLDHDRGIQLWGDILRKGDDLSISWWTAREASRRLAPCLLDRAVTANQAALPGSESYLSRLEALTKMNNAVIRKSRQSQSDPHLYLARFYCLSGDHLSSFSEAQTRLCSVFDKWPEDATDDSLRLRFSNLAQTLTVLDKDVDAIAAWQTSRPLELQQPCTVEVPATIDLQPIDSTSSPSQPDSSLAKTAEAPKNGQDACTSVNAEPQAYIASYCCDGGCGTGWRDMLADCWVCKNCLCVQLCPACYQKLQTDGLHPLVCNPNHKLLYLPPFNKNLWQGMSADLMIVDKQPVPRSEWLNKIRNEYKVQQDQIDMLKMEKARKIKAAACIAKYVLRWRRRLLRIKAKKDATIPKLRRARTIM